MSRDAAAGDPIITALSAAGFRIGEEIHPALLMTTERAVPWSPPALAALDVAALAPLVAAHPEFILIGTGRSLVRPSPALMQALEAQDIGVEVMDSRAAARAWGVLRGEGRSVAAALYPLGA